MKKSIKKGFSFGLTSGIITTLGLIVGLYSITESKLAVIGGIFVIAIADAFSDAMGIHVSEESDKTNSKKEIWEATISTLFSKFFFALSFVVPILLFNFGVAIIVNIAWGMLLMTILSFYISKGNEDSHGRVIIEHLAIAIFVIVITYYVGRGVKIFGVV